MNVESVRALVREIADFPKPGVNFKDITPVLGDASAFEYVVEHMASELTAADVDFVLGLEARGFIFAAPIAIRLSAGFVPIRKAGKLPYDVESQSFTLEYGDATLEIHSDAISPGSRCLIVDDVLATGATASASCELVERLGGSVVGVAVFIELDFLEGRKKLAERAISTVLRYS